MPVFYVVCNHFYFEIILFQLLLSLVCYHFRLYFVSLILNISVFVSINEIISFSFSFNFR